MRFDMRLVKLLDNEAIRAEVIICATVTRDSSSMRRNLLGAGIAAVQILFLFCFRHDDDRILEE